MLNITLSPHTALNLAALAIIFVSEINALSTKDTRFIFLITLLNSSLIILMFILEVVTR